MKHRAALLAAGLVALTPLLTVPPTAQAATSCSVKYTIVNQWPGGFQGGLTITNTGDAWSSWSLSFGFPDGQSISQMWIARFQQSGANVTVSNEAWNGAVASGQSVQPGFIGSWNGSNGAPTSFSVNGVACNGGSTITPTTTTTTRPTTTTTTTTTTRPTTTTTTTTTRPTTTTTTTSQNTGAAPALHVSGNRLLTSSGQPYRLLGVNRSGGEFTCIQGYGMWNGPMDQASIDAMRAWKVRAVRVPLNEECWLGTANVPSGGTSGAAYQTEVKNYVDLLISNGITPIVEMHWNYGQYSGQGAGCSDTKASCQKPMPDAQYAPEFWTGVANTFKGNDAVILDLFNEPYPDAANGWTDAAAAWKCWRDGGTCTGISYQVAGFQSLLNAVRATGATNVVMVGGIRWSNDLSQWLTYKPTDPLNNLMAFAHIYNFNACIDSTCWDREWAPVAAQVPLAITEIGENTCGHSFIDKVMAWADSHDVGYLGWTWNNWDCSTGPSLITDYTGTPTAFGQGLKDHLATVSD